MLLSRYFLYFLESVMTHMWRMYNTMSCKCKQWRRDADDNNKLCFSFFNISRLILKTNSICLTTDVRDDHIICDDVMCTLCIAHDQKSITFYIMLNRLVNSVWNIIIIMRNVTWSTGFLAHFQSLAIVIPVGLFHKHITHCLIWLLYSWL